MIPKDKYAIFCEQESIPVFSQPWWLDATCGKDNWDIILIEDNNHIIASFPYTIKKKNGLKCIIQPPLTPKIGPYIKYPQDIKVRNQISLENKIFDQIIGLLPKHDIFTIAFDYKYQNWLSFYWHSFNQSTRYTYIIDDISDYETILRNFESSKRNHLNRAIREGLKIHLNELPPDHFYNYYQDILKSKNNKISYPSLYFIRLCEASISQDQGAILHCTDDKGNIHGAIYFVWDKQSAYFLVSAFNPAYTYSGASTFLISEMIRFLPSKGITCLDFEGSMIKGVETSFREYGGTPKSYFIISKHTSRKAKLLRALKDFLFAFNTAK